MPNSWDTRRHRLRYVVCAQAREAARPFKAGWYLCVRDIWEVVELPVQEETRAKVLWQVEEELYE